jgi:putative DNA primase/helicase
VSYHDAVADFIAAMEIEGVRPIEPIAQRLSSGELIRFRCDGDGKGRQNGWAKLYLDDRPAGAFGNYRLGISRKWKSGDDRTLSPEERAAMQREWAAAKQKRQEERERSEAEAARDAADIWTGAGPARADHPYAAKKQLDVSRLRQRDGRLLVPMFDATGALWNLQRIDGEGNKRFLRGGRTDALFCFIGDFNRAGETCCIGEGYATMAAVNRASDHPCVVAFSAKNLAAVARIWREARPDLDYIICADDDAHLDRNIGQEAAHAAALEIGARVATPIGRAA